MRDVETLDAEMLARWHALGLGPDAETAKFGRQIRQAGRSKACALGLSELRSIGANAGYR